MAAQIEDDKIDTEIAEPVSARDEINNDVVAAIASLKGEAEPEPKIETEQPEAAPRERGADGKFVAKEAVAEKPVAEPKLPPPEDVTKASEQPSNAGSAPPVSWAADAKQTWASLPPAVQQAVLKREQEASNGFKQYSEKTAAYERALTPIAQEAQKRGLGTEEGIQRLMDGQRFLEEQPAQAILWLAQRNGIDLAELASNPPQPGRADPMVSQVRSSVSTLEQRIAQIEQGAQQREYEGNLAASNKFAADNPYFADVEDMLPEIMMGIRAANPALSGIELLQKAYDQAIWTNPDIRAKVLAEQNAKVAQEEAAKLAQKANQASRAAISVKGSSAPASTPARRPESTGDIYDDVRAAVHQLRAG